MSAIRQHLIDPEVCIRCNTCEENCPIDGAITHNEDNYVVNVELCNYCMNCVAPCPTGAIDHWRMVSTPYSLEEQFEWDELPDETEVATTESGLANASHEALEDEANEILDVAHQGQQGKVLPPFSAAHPFINIYTRENPAIATVAGNYRITSEDSESDIHHIVLDFGTTAFPVLEGQSIGVIPPGKDARGKAHNVRLYSVASPRDGERPNHNNLSLTVKRVVFEEDGVVKKGVGSNYVCDLKKGDQVQVTGAFGSTFLMPNHPEANIMMICTGTGSAPFRAMTERRRRKRQPGDKGKMMLFFGARTKGDLPYFGPLNKLPDSLIRKELCFSREADQPKEYVQDRILKCADDVAAWLKDDQTFIYLCGLKGMELGVEEAFAKTCRDHGLDWPALRNKMRESGRYHVETY
ncbi:MAG: benzoyl-CoA 2,3-epoxidase subunit BoxA [Methylocystaceae bacterium]|nr:benzoyl-CoA 2,3-epoxidase subunit BoxA [Methylocystaceae bacterium]